MGGKLELGTKSTVYVERIRDRERSVCRGRKFIYIRPVRRCGASAGILASTSGR